MTKIEAICWDLDNTIIPSKRIAIEIMNEVLPRLGINDMPDFDKHHTSFGLPIDEFLRLHTNDYHDQDEVFRYFNDAQQHYYEHEVAFFEGMIEAIKAFQDNGFKQALVTTRRHTGRKSASPLEILKKLGISEAVSTIVTGDDVTHHKPHTEPIELAMNKMGTDPEQTVMIGDQTVDIQMAKAAGCKAIGIDHEGNPDFMASLWEAGADHVVSSAASLQIAVEELVKSS